MTPKLECLYCKALCSFMMREFTPAFHWFRNCVISIGTERFIDHRRPQASASQQYHQNIPRAARRQDHIEPHLEKLGSSGPFLEPRECSLRSRNLHRLSAMEMQPVAIFD